LNKTNLFLSVGILSTLLVPFFFDSIYAKEHESSQQIPDILIFVQTFVIDSEKNLVAYLNSNEFTYVNTGELNPFLDSVATKNDEIIEVNEQKFQIIKRERTIFLQSESVIASTLLVETIDENY